MKQEKIKPVTTGASFNSYESIAEWLKDNDDYIEDSRELEQYQSLFIELGID